MSYRKKLFVGLKIAVRTSLLFRQARNSEIRTPAITENAETYVQFVTRGLNDPLLSRPAPPHQANADQQQPDTNSFTLPVLFTKQ